jgi:hypothetical protein
VPRIFWLIRWSGSRLAAGKQATVTVAGITRLEARRFALSRGRAERLLAVPPVLTCRRIVLLQFPYTFRKPGEPIQNESERPGDPTLKTRIKINNDCQDDVIVIMNTVERQFPTEEELINGWTLTYSAMRMSTGTRELDQLQAATLCR